MLLYIEYSYPTSFCAWYLNGNNAKTNIFQVSNLLENKPDSESDMSHDNHFIYIVVVYSNYLSSVGTVCYQRGKRRLNMHQSVNQ